jgi:hypothetical protein
MKVIFGSIEFGDFVKCGDKYPMALVKNYFTKDIEEDEIEDYAWENRCEYVVPSEFRGEIYFIQEAK